MKHALAARHALVLFSTRENDFEYGLPPYEWEIIEFVCKFLEPFNEVTNLFMVLTIPLHLYFANIVAIRKLLVVAHKHSVYSIRTMCKDMMDKNEKYWSYHSIILSVAVSSLQTLLYEELVQLTICS